MSLRLPRPIECYFAAENADDSDDVDSHFSASATVLDEGGTHKGLAAIRRWKMEAKQKYSHRVEPLRAEQRDGITVVESRVSGNFPGSPVTLAFSFRLSGDKIESLEIRLAKS